MGYDKTRQNELVQLARAGDQPAMNLLVRELEKMVSKKASQYAKVSECQYDDLVQEAWAKLPVAVKGYDPAHGSFFNYFCCLAFRDLAKVARESTKTREVYDLPLDDFAGRDGPEEIHDAQDWLSHLDGIQRYIVERRSGYNGFKTPMSVVARDLGISCWRVKEIEEESYERLRAKLT